MLRYRWQKKWTNLCDCELLVYFILIFKIQKCSWVPEVESNVKQSAYIQHFPEKFKVQTRAEQENNMTDSSNGKEENQQFAVSHLHCDLRKCQK